MSLGFAAGRGGRWATAAAGAGSERRGSGRFGSGARAALRLLARLRRLGFRLCGSASGSGPRVPAAASGSGGGTASGSGAASASGVAAAASSARRAVARARACDRFVGVWSGLDAGSSCDSASLGSGAGSGPASDAGLSSSSDAAAAAMAARLAVDLARACDRLVGVWAAFDAAASGAPDPAARRPARVRSPGSSPDRASPLSRAPRASPWTWREPATAWSACVRASWSAVARRRTPAAASASGSEVGSGFSSDSGGGRECRASCGRSRTFLRPARRGVPRLRCRLGSALGGPRPPSTTNRAPERDRRPPGTSPDRLRRASWPSSGLISSWCDES